MIKSALMCARNFVFASGRRVLATGSVAALALTVLAALTLYSSSCGAKASPKPSPKPSQSRGWPMFHGSFGHAGYAPVAGPRKAHLKWRYRVTDGTGSPPGSVAVGDDGTIYVAGGNTIVALTPTGAVRWSRTYPNTAGPALGRDGSVYFLSNEGDVGSVVALDASGTERWRFATGGAVHFGPTIGPDGKIYQGSWDKYFYALNPDGTLAWKYLTAGAVSYPASLDRDGKTVYLGGGDAHAGPDPNLYAFTPQGKLRWKRNTGVERVGSPAVAGALAYVPAAPSLLAVKSSGKVSWKLSGKCPPPPAKCGRAPEAGIITPAVGRDGTIYVGSSQGVLFAIDPKTHSVKWSFKQRGATTAETTQPPPPGQPPPNGGEPVMPKVGFPSFPVVDRAGTVYVGATDGTMYAVNRRGKRQWSYKTGAAITEASPAFGRDGTLYFSSGDGYLYAIGS